MLLHNLGFICALIFIGASILYTKRKGSSLHRQALAALANPSMRAVAITALRSETERLSRGDGIRTYRGQSWFHSPRRDAPLCRVRLDLAELLIADGRPAEALIELDLIGAHTLTSQENGKKKVLTDAAKDFVQKLR